MRYFSFFSEKEINLKINLDRDSSESENQAFSKAVHRILSTLLMAAVLTLLVKYQFDCGILKMVGLEKQDFWPRINILKVDDLRFVKKCQNCTFKVKNQPNFFKKKFHLRISI